MQDLKKNNEETEIKNEESKVEVKEEKNNVVEEIKNEIKEETVKVKIGTVGNAVLFAFFALVVATGILAYYLIHSTKDNIDQQYSNLVSDLAAYENIVEEGGSVANIIDEAIAGTGLVPANNTVATEVTDDRKIMNEELVVLYKGLILDTTKMDEVKLKYIDNKIDEEVSTINTAITEVSNEAKAASEKVINIESNIETINNTMRTAIMTC